MKKRKKIILGSITGALAFSSWLEAVFGLIKPFVPQENAN